MCTPLPGVRTMGETTVWKGLVSLAVMVAFLGWSGLTRAAWVTVAKDREREVQVDTETILPAEAGIKVAWGRVILAPSEAERLGFAMIRALNRFDCQHRTFTTVKRVYLDAEGLPIRDEAVAQEQAVPVVKGSVDERLWRAVCEPMSPQALQRVAAQALASAKSAMEPGDPTTHEGASHERAAPAHAAPTAAQAAPAMQLAEGAQKTHEPSEGAIPIGVDLADPSQLPPEIAQLPVPNLLPKKPKIVTTPGAHEAVAPSPPSKMAAQSAASDRHAPGGQVATTHEASTQHGANPPTTETAHAVTPHQPSAQKTERGVPAVAEHRYPAAPSVTRQPRAHTGAQTALTVTSQHRPVATGNASSARSRTRRVLPPPDAWRYEGAGGPAVWDRMDPEWRICRAGRRQSPITLRGAIPSSVPPPEWFVRPAWHTVSQSPQGEIVLVPRAPQSLRWRGVVWQLQRASWHHPVLHPGRSGGPWLGSWVLAFVGNGARLFVEIPVAQSTRTAPELEALAQWAQGGRNASRLRWDWRSLLPVFDTFYLYEGSEPWPPCREGVVWLVYQSGTEAEGGVIAPLLAGPRTSRPPQPANGRLLLEAIR